LSPIDRLTRYLSDARAELVRFAARRGAGHAAEDVVQDTWLRLREGADPATWREPRAVLFTTAANLAIDAQRRDGRAARLAEAVAGEAASSAAPGPDRLLEGRARVERLAAALDSVPPACRDAFLMNRLEGLTHRQIARRLGVSTKTVQRCIERALLACVAAAGAEADGGSPR
jgi:RNA polymerase sigma factor (sigma-70 family)